MNWNTDVSFCDDAIMSSQEVVGLLADNLHLGEVRSVLQERYERMQSLFKDVQAGDSRWQQDGCEGPEDKDVLLGIPRNKFRDDNAMWCGNGGLLSLPNLGLDLPTWMKKRDVDSKTRIMIIAMEPLRNRDSGALWLSSPWAFHSDEYRRTVRPSPFLRRVVESFMEKKNAVVYLTDLFKLYADDGECTRTHFNKEYDAILKREMDIFKPDVILGFGKDVAAALGQDFNGLFSKEVCRNPHEGMFNKIRVLSFLHPSPSNANAQNSICDARPNMTREDALLDYYTNWQ